jgi:hypothetical protein
LYDRETLAPFCPVFGCGLVVPLLRFVHENFYGIRGSHLHNRPIGINQHNRVVVSVCVEREVTRCVYTEVRSAPHVLRQNRIRARPLTQPRVIPPCAEVIESRPFIELLAREPRYAPICVTPLRLGLPDLPRWL